MVCIENEGGSDTTLISLYSGKVTTSSNIWIVGFILLWDPVIITSSPSSVVWVLVCRGFFRTPCFSSQWLSGLSQSNLRPSIWLECIPCLTDLLSIGAFLPCSLVSEYSASQSLLDRVVGVVCRYVPVSLLEKKFLSRTRKKDPSLFSSGNLEEIQVGMWDTSNLLLDNE